MIIRKAEIEKTAVSPADYPSTGLPEIAFAGKSNVGKSSLINSLVNRKALARTSSTPGKTRTINFFNINDDMYFVDLPGYGYAKVSKEEKSKWGGMIEGYLNTREELALVVLLVDSRHEPSANDKMMMEWMRASGVQSMVIATKVDKLSKNDLFKHFSVIRKALQLSKDDILIPFSTTAKLGQQEFWNVVEEIIKKADSE